MSKKHSYITGGKAKKAIKKAIIAYFATASAEENARIAELVRENGGTIPEAELSRLIKKVMPERYAGYFKDGKLIVEGEGGSHE